MTHTIPRTFAEWISSTVDRNDSTITVVGGEYRGTSPQAKGTVGAGGHLVSDVSMATLDRALSLDCPLWNVSTIHRTTSGAALPIPTTSDLAASAIVAENASAHGTLSDVTFGQLVLSSFNYNSGVVLVPVELIQDGLLATKDWWETLGGRMARGFDSALVAGAGTTAPFGIMTSATSSSITTAATTYAVGDELLQLKSSVAAGYHVRPSCCYLTNPVTWRLTKAAMDATSLPFLRLKQGNELYDSFDGHPVLLSDSVSVTPGGRAWAFGDMSKYHIRVLPPVARALTERYSDYHQVGFMMLQRMDAGLAIPAAVAYALSHA